MRRSDVFEPLEPPPGGVPRLRARLRERARRDALRLAVLATAPALAAAVWMAFGPRERPRVDLVALARAYDAPSEPVTVRDPDRAALQRVPSTDPRVVMYRVAVLDEQPRNERRSAGR